MKLHTVSARAAAALVAGIAGAASWEHIASVAAGAGERPWVAYSLPAAIDGLIVVGVAALLADRHEGRRPRISARVAVLVGVVATLAANVASAEPGLTAALVAVAAPVSFLLSVEVLTRTGRPAEDRTKGTATSPDLDKSRSDKSDSKRRVGGKRTAAEKVAAARAKFPDATQGEVAKRAKVSVRTAARYWRDSQPEPAAEPSPNSREHAGSPELAEVTS